MTRRIGVVFPLPLDSGHLGKDVCLIPEGLARLGYDVALYCPEADETDWPIPVVEAGAAVLGDARYWREQALDGAVVYSFLRHARIVTAVSASGTRVIAKGDTTGHVIARVHPRRTLVEDWYAAENGARRLLALAYWLARLGPLHGRESRDMLTVIRAADATVVETDPARVAVEQALRREDAADLVPRIAVVANPIDPAFSTGSVPANRERLVVAVGRWDLKIKDAGLLRAALDRFLAARRDYRAVVVGRGQGTRFRNHGSGRLASAGQLAHEQIAQLLRRARIILSTSHSESFSLSSHEGLALGCSVVGPALHPLRDAVGAGPYGTIADGRRSVAIARALSDEAAAWEDGERDPVAAASFWRPRLDVAGAAREFAALLLDRSRW